ncbi:MAG: HD domain-containing protein [Victivallaceae bacterium]|nr:HD domain-containing protein [Victivallaceae bacterium]
MNYAANQPINSASVFSAYTGTFLTGSAEFDKNVLLKTEHSRFVQSECRQLAEAERFPRHLAAITETAGLFHDIGRFEQLRRYNTFVDARSVDHGRMGCEVLLERRLLAFLPEEDAELVRRVTAVHNKRRLPDNLSGETRLVAQAVRDADKLDIMRVVLNEYAKGKLDELVILHLEESDRVSPRVLAHLEQGENPDIADFTTLTDFKLAQLAWIYDLNFPHSRREFKARGFYDQVTATLPDTPQINRICRRLLEHLNAGIE